MNEYTPDDFYEGQEVIVTGDTYPDLVGKTGVIAFIKKRSYTGTLIGVDFRPLRQWKTCSFHNLEGRLKNSTGWWFPFNELEPFDTGLASIDGEALDAFLN